LHYKQFASSLLLKTPPLGRLSIGIDSSNGLSPIGGGAAGGRLPEMEIRNIDAGQRPHEQVKSMSTKSLSLTVFLVALPCVKADMTVRQYRETFSGKNGAIQRSASDAYILGLGSGIEQMNVEVALSKGQPLFCMPESVKLGVGDYRGMIDREIDKFVQADKLLGTNHMTNVETYDIGGPAGKSLHSSISMQRGTKTGSSTASLSPRGLTHRRGIQ
jgi:hypothetical protein